MNVVVKSMEFTAQGQVLIVLELQPKDEAQHERLATALKDAQFNVVPTETNNLLQLFIGGPVVNPDPFGKFDTLTIYEALCLRIPALRTWTPPTPSEADLEPDPNIE